MTDAEDVEMIKKWYSFPEIPGVVRHSNSGIIMPSVSSFILVFILVF